MFKFSPAGRVLLTLGKAGVAWTGKDTFNEPNDVINGAERRHLRLEWAHVYAAAKRLPQ